MFLHFKAPSKQRRSSLAAPSCVRLVRTASLFIALALLLLIFHQKISAQTQDETEVLRVRTDLITVPLFVTDRSGNRISGLQSKDFVVRDNGQEVETFYFAQGTERVALLFALDASGSARDIITEQRAAALSLFERFGKTSRVAVMRFTERPVLAAPFTTDASAAQSAFNFPALIGQRTAIFDAAREAVRDFATPDRAERRIVVLISDGLDTASMTAASRVIGEALESGVSFYVIHLPLFEPHDGRLQPRAPSKGFRDLAEKTGGKYFMIGDAKTALAARPQYDLSRVFQAIEDDLRGQYVLGYYPPEGARDSLPHRIEVRLASGNNKRLRVQALRSTYVLKNVE
jgi:Ca-activated chloride channel family protein